MEEKEKYPLNSSENPNQNAYYHKSTLYSMITALESVAIDRPVDI